MEQINLSCGCKEWFEEIVAVQTGSHIETAPRFCPWCGKPLISPSSECVNCSYENPNVCVDCPVMEVEKNG